MISRRLAVTGASALTGMALSGWACADTVPTTETERSIGSADAKTTIEEFYSLTCPHCANFSKLVMPKVMAELVNPGRLRIVYHDFPLDRLALQAAMVARYLPPAEYGPFSAALLASQERWVYAQGSTPIDEIWKLAARAGISRGTFDAALQDAALQNWILTQMAGAARRLNVRGTPSFLIGDKLVTGETTYGVIAAAVPGAA
jgi:protein-disulfide isomerase